MKGVQGGDPIELNLVIVVEVIPMKSNIISSSTGVLLKIILTFFNFRAGVSNSNCPVGHVRLIR